MTTTKSTQPGPVLVLGGTGKTGSRVAAALTERGVPVRIGSRKGGPPFDWTDRSTWSDALDGMAAVYIAYAPDLAVPGAPDDIAAFVRRAADAGVEQVVLLSGRGEPEAEQCEKIVRESGLSWTIVRASWFAQNFSEGPFRDELAATGSLSLPVGNIGEPFVDASDIADVAVAALSESGHDGRLYEVTGPRLLTFAEAVDEIATASGRTIAFRPVSLEEYDRELAALGISEGERGLLSYLFTEVLDGRNAYLADGVQEALGRPPRDFATYAAAVAGRAVW